MQDELDKEVDLLNKAVFGDRENPKESPGVIAELARMSMVQERTNEILMELRNAVLWINGLLVTGVITGMIGLVFKVAT
jgi:hypothetical protein